MNIVFMDGYDSVRDAQTQGTEVFSTILPDDLAELVCRSRIPEEVVDNVVNTFNAHNDLVEVDTYLLDEEKITQDEREIIVEGIAKFMGLND